MQAPGNSGGLPYSVRFIEAAGHASGFNRRRETSVRRKRVAPEGGGQTNARPNGVGVSRNACSPPVEVAKTRQVPLLTVTHDPERANRPKDDVEAMAWLREGRYW